ncbi:uncharacterized protein [Agelaius tricolor]|uniref:uncharacterized protein n=1 Tax=Agelaius tricolor TaxID=9191 RepID=UPI0039F22E9A
MGMEGMAQSLFQNIHSKDAVASSTECLHPSCPEDSGLLQDGSLGASKSSSESSNQGGSEGRSTAGRESDSEGGSKGVSEGGSEGGSKDVSEGDGEGGSEGVGEGDGEGVGESDGEGVGEGVSAGPAALCRGASRLAEAEVRWETILEIASNGGTGSRPDTRMSVNCLQNLYSALQRCLGKPQCRVSLKGFSRRFRLYCSPGGLLCQGSPGMRGALEQHGRLRGRGRMAGPLLPAAPRCSPLLPAAPRCSPLLPRAPAGAPPAATGPQPRRGGKVQPPRPARQTPHPAGAAGRPSRRGRHRLEEEGI